MKCAICWEDEADTCRRADHSKATLARATARGRPWSMLVVIAESGRRRSIESGAELIYGDRHHLDGRPIHCGDAIELQRISFASDEFGDFTTYFDEGTVVRYEVEHVSRVKAVPGGAVVTARVPVMYGTVAGHLFKAAIDAGCFFRWPRRD